MDPDWAARRGQAISAHARDLERREEAETRRAREMLTDFVRAALEKGIAPVPLRARSYDGRQRYRTGLHGWYLHGDEAMAVGADGEFYILSVPGSVRALVTGVRLRPDRARTVIGEGGRDGDRVALRTLLDRILAGAPDGGAPGGGAPGVTGLPGGAA
ncbi:hypothetical protein Val02_45430 [Virgisporangium aliadipatigenens]|uniref:Uncharacterized protein n=1 Tax=Virgisporangium aliadipatigenens TaxID=741659 RepID=A0A8J3YNG7_9ACTN|nr:hypothetical protein [Virgisporangium aliadipatigenens]GIJ47657.1 hypothetical protein Val02_45430 [Virgisporangium aliadipatigenens]